MKTIGIKLADGSFYPVLKEGSPSERLLELTTAHNNQTKVMVDLYRSELESMEDAEYVDSLQIEDLNEHPNGEPTLTFTVSIDENNKLSAKMVDNETGLQSNATITLVSRTLEERLLPDEYDIKDPTIEGVSLSETEENTLFGNDDEVQPEADQSIDFNFDPDLPDFNESAPESTTPDESPVESEPDVINEFDAPVEETAISEEENTLPEPELPPTSSELDSIRDQLVAEPDAADIAEIQQEPASDEFELPPMSDFNPLDEPILEDDALAIDEFQTEDEEETATEEETIASEPVLEDSNVEDATIISEEPPAEEPVSEESLSDETTDDSSLEDFSAEDVPDETISSDPLDLSFDIPEEKPQNSIDEAETPTESTALSGDFDLPDTTNSNSLDDLDLPDFDSSFETNFDTDSSNLSTGDSDLNLSDSFDSTEPEPSTSDVFNTDDLDFGDLDSTLTSSTSSSDSDNSNAYLDDLDFDDLDTSTSSQPAGKGLSFTGLYDKETAMGNSAANSDDDERKNPKAAVIICILCAIICVLATMFVLMVLTPNFKLFGKKDKADVSTQVTSTELPDLRPAEAKPVEKAPEPEPMPAPEPLPPVPQAQEEEVVVIENAEDVVPLPPPVTPVKPKDINYKIKWGDTLWDISDTYYKNPWRYKYIARYNGIKNPDYIISGTYITIPAE